MKKSIALILSLVLIMGITFLNVGCSPVAVTPVVSEKPTEKPTEAIKEPGVVKIFSQDSSYIQKNYNMGLDTVKEMEKALNIKIEWELMPYSGYEDALQIKLAAGSGMPDIFSTWKLIPEDLYRNGAIVALSDYFDTTMLQTKAAIAKDSSLKAAVTSPDGKVLFLTQVSPTESPAWFVRQDWLDKLGLKQPTTIDELYNVLVAFRDNDPNGNKKKDEVPIAFDYLNYTWMQTMEAFGLFPVASWNWIGKDSTGKFNAYVTQPQFKEVIAFIHKLYAEKLMNQDILNVSAESYMQIISDNQVGVVHKGLSEDIQTSIEAAHPDVHPIWSGILPPKGPRGESGVRVAASMNGSFFVAKNGKNPTDATRLFNFLFADPAGSDLMNFGIVGKTYNKVDGVVKFTDFVTNNSEKLSSFNALASVGAKMIMPFKKDLTALDELFYQQYPWLGTIQKLYKSKVSFEAEKKYRFSSDESLEITNIMSKVDSYINETLAKMIVGNESLDNFDNFVKTLKDKGIDRMVEIYQKVDQRSK